MFRLCKQEVRGSIPVGSTARIACNECGPCARPTRAALGEGGGSGPIGSVCVLAPQVSTLRLVRVLGVTCLKQTAYPSLTDDGELVDAELTKIDVASQ